MSVTLVKTEEALQTRTLDECVPFVDVEFVNSLPVEPGMKILDVGFLKGRDLWQLHTHHSEAGLELYGVDRLQECLDYTRAFFGKVPIELVLAEADNLPFADKYFDIVYANGLISDLADGELDGVMLELLRVGKRVFIADVRPDDSFYSQEVASWPTVLGQ